MLTPERPCGLALVTDRDGNWIAVIDPLSHRVVPALGAPAPLVARADAGGPVVRTVVDSTDLAASRDRSALLGALTVLHNRPDHEASWGRFDAEGGPGLTAARNQFSGVFPDQGSTSGGTLVTIIGRNFARATAVTFGLRPAASFTVLDDETIVAVTPSGQGAVPITVTTPGGSVRVGYFFYITWPSLATMSPPRDRSAGATPSSSPAPACAPRFLSTSATPSPSPQRSPTGRSVSPFLLPRAPARSRCTSPPSAG